jgi:hypothetical protein
MTSAALPAVRGKRHIWSIGGGRAIGKTLLTAAWAGSWHA